MSALVGEYTQTYIANKHNIKASNQISPTSYALEKNLAIHSLDLILKITVTLYEKTPSLLSYKRLKLKQIYINIHLKCYKTLSPQCSYLNNEHLWLQFNLHAFYFRALKYIYITIGIECNPEKYGTRFV